MQSTVAQPRVDPQRYVSMEGFQSSVTKLLRTAKIKFSRRKLENSDPVSCFDRYDLHAAAVATTEAFAIASECTREQMWFELDKFSPDVAGYAFDGAALAIGLNAAATQAWDQLENFLVSLKAHQLAVTAGCGGAFMHAGLSIASISEAVDPFWRALLAEGFAFHESFYNVKRIVVNQEAPQVSEIWERRAYNQGIGRTIWFAAGGRPEIIKELINQFASWQRSDLWYGVGLQAAYCGGTEKEYQQLRHHSGKQLDGLTAGVSMAVFMRASSGHFPDHTSYASEAICGAKAPDIASLFDERLSDTRKSCNKAELFLELRKQLAHSVLS